MLSVLVSPRTNPTGLPTSLNLAMSVATGPTTSTGITGGSGSSGESSRIANGDLVHSDALKLLLAGPAPHTAGPGLLSEVPVERIHILHDMVGRIYTKIYTTTTTYFYHTHYLSDWQGVGLLTRVHHMQKVFTDYERRGDIPHDVHKNNKHANQAAVVYDFPFIIKAKQFSEISSIIIRHYPAVVSSYTSIDKEYDSLIEKFGDEILNKLDTTMQLYMDVLDFQAEAVAVLLSLPKLVESWSLESNKAVTILYFELLTVFVKVLLLLSQNNDDNRTMAGLYYSALFIKKKQETAEAAATAATTESEKKLSKEVVARSARGRKVSGRATDSSAETTPVSRAAVGAPNPYLEYMDRVLCLLHSAADPKGYLLRTFNSVALPAGGLLPMLLQLRDPLQLHNDVEHIRAMSIFRIAKGESSFAQLPLPVLNKGHKDNSSDEKSLDQDYSQYPSRKGVDIYYELAHCPKYTDYLVYALYAAPFLLFDSDVLSLYRLVCTKRLFVTIYRDFSLSIHREFQSYVNDYTSIKAQRQLDIISSIPIDTKTAETLQLTARSAAGQAGKVMTHRRSFILGVLRDLRLALASNQGLLAPKCPLVLAALALARQEIQDYFMHSYSDSEYADFIKPSKFSKDSVGSHTTLSRPVDFLVADYMNIREDVAEYYKVSDYRSPEIMSLVSEVYSLVAFVNHHWQTIVKPYYVEYITFGDIKYLRPIIDAVASAPSSYGDGSDEASASLVTLVHTIDTYLQGVSDAYFYHKLSNRNSKGEDFAGRRASATGLTAVTMDIQYDMMLIRIAWDKACALISQRGLLSAELEAARSRDDAEAAGATTGRPLHRLVRRMSDVTERICYIDSLDFVLQALCDPCECVYHSERLRQAAGECLLPREVVFGRHAVENSAAPDGASVATSKTDQSTLDTDAAAAMADYSMISDSSDAFLAVFSMLNGVLRTVHSDFPKEVFVLQMWAEGEAAGYLDMYTSHFVGCFEDYWVSLQALDNQTCAVEAAVRLARFVQARAEAAASGSAQQVEPEQLPGAESEAWARLSIIALVKQQLNLSNMLQSALANRSLLVDRKEYDVLAILQDKLIKYIFGQFHKLYPGKQTPDDAKALSADADVGSMPQFFHRSTAALRKITLGIQSASSLFSSVGSGDKGGFLEAVRVLLFRELVDTKKLGPCGTSIGVELGEQEVGESLIWKIADNFLVAIRMLEDPRYETVYVLSERAFRSRSSPRADSDDSLTSLSRPPSATTALLDTYISAADLTALCHLAGPQGVRAITMRIFSCVAQHLAVVFTFLKVNAKALGGVRAGSTGFTPADIERLRSDLQDLDGFTGALISIGVCLAMREALLGALRGVSSSRSTSLFDALTTTVSVMHPFSTDINTFMQTANLAADMGLSLQHDAALLSSLDDVIRNDEEEENRRHLHLFPAACSTCFLSDVWAHAAFDAGSESFGANEHCIVLAVSKLLFVLYGFAQGGGGPSESYHYNQERQHRGDSNISSEYNHSKDDYCKSIKEYVQTSSLLLLLLYRRELDALKSGVTPKALVVLLERFVQENSHAVSRHDLEAGLPYCFVHACALDLGLGIVGPGNMLRSFSELREDEEERGPRDSADE